MKYNKFEIHKTKEHKILRKVKKNWIIISMSFFSFVGGGMLIDDGTNVHADTINSNNSSSDSTISSASTNSSASASMETSATSIGTNSYASANDNNTYSNSISVTSSSANASNNSSSVELASTNVSNNSSSSSSTSTNISNININISSASLSEMVNNISSIPTSTNASSNNISATSISTDASSNNSKSTSESSNNSSSVTSSSTSTSSYDSNSSSASMDSSNNNVISPSYSANDGTGIQNIDDFDWAITIGEADYVNAKDAGDWAKKIDPMGAQWLPIIQQYVNNGNYIVIPQEHIEDAQKLFNSYVKDNNLSGDYINYENHPFDRSDDYSVEGEVNDPYVQSEDGVKNVAEFSYNYNHDDNLYSYFPTDSLQLNNIVVPIDFGNGGSSGTYVSNPDDNEDEISTDFQKISNYAGHYQAPIYLITMKDLTNTFDKYSTARANPKSDNNENNSAYYNYDGQATAGIPLDYMIYLHPQVYDKNGQLVTSDLTKSAPIVNIHYLDVNNNNKQVGTQDIFAVPNTKLNNYLLTPTPGYQIQDLNGYVNVTDSQKDYGVNVIEADSSAVSNSSESSSTSSSTASASNNSSANSFIYNSENSSEKASASNQAASSDSSSTSSLSSESSRDSVSNNSVVDSSTYNSEKASAASQAASSDSAVASSEAAEGNNILASSASIAAISEANDYEIISNTVNNNDNTLAGNNFTKVDDKLDELTDTDNAIIEKLSKYGFLTDAGKSAQKTLKLNKLIEQANLPRDTKGNLDMKSLEKFLSDNDYLESTKLSKVLGIFSSVLGKVGIVGSVIGLGIDYYQIHQDIKNDTEVSDTKITINLERHTVKDIQDAVYDLADTIVPIIVGKVGELALKPVCPPVGAFISPAVGAGLNFLTDKLINIFKDLSDSEYTNLNPSEDIAKFSYDYSTKAFTLGIKINGKMNEVQLNPIKDLEDAAKGIKTDFDNSVAKVEQVAQTTKNIVEHPASAVSSVASGVVSDAQNAASDLTNTVEHPVSAASTAISNAISNPVSAVTNFL